MRTNRTILLAFGISAAFAFGVAGSAAAAPGANAGTLLKQANPASVVTVAETKTRKKRRAAPRRQAPRAYYGGPPRAYYGGPPRAYYGGPPRGYYARPVPPPPIDNVGSIIYDGIGYGYNSRTGERYMTCQIDEGYGRVTPCDAGGGGGGGLN